MHFVTTYKEFHQPNLRSTLRHYALSGLSLVQANASKIKQKRVVFTCFHNFFEDTENNLRKQLEFLSNHFTFISYTEGTQRVLSGDIDDNYICFSADDGYKDFLYISRIFDEFGIKGLVFANPKVIGEKDYDELKAFNKNRLSHGPMEFLDWNDIDDLLSRGHEVGNHTFTHRNVGACSKEELQEQVVHAYDILKAHIGPDLHFAWPYGSDKDINQEALNLIYDIGHVSASAVDRHSHYKQFDFQTERSYLVREQIEPFYPVSHVKYFLSKDYSDIEHKW